MLNRITYWLKFDRISNQDLQMASDATSRDCGVILSNTAAEMIKLSLDYKELILYNMQLIDKAMELESKPQELKIKGEK